MTLSQQTKKEIAWKLRNYVSGFPSQKQAANSLKDVSEATLINIIKEKWDSISDAMFINIQNQLDGRGNDKPIVETESFRTLILYYQLAQEHGSSFAIVGGAGWGKTFAGKKWSNVNRDKNVFYLECAEYWNKKMFLSAILQVMGKSSAGMNVGELMLTIVTELRHLNKPVFIFDEIDKLTDPVLKFFITLYNELNGACGFVWQSTNNIEKRMMKGISMNKNGYQELFSRIGMRFIQLPGATASEIKELCHLNNITDQEEIARIINECRGDLRRVDRNFLKAAAVKLRDHIKRNGINNKAA